MVFSRHPKPTKTALGEFYDFVPTGRTSPKPWSHGRQEISDGDSSGDDTSPTGMAPLDLGDVFLGAVERQPHALCCLGVRSFVALPLEFP